MKTILTTICAAVLFWSAAKPEQAAKRLTQDTGSIKIVFDNIVGDQNLQLNTGVYSNAAGEAFTVTLFNYYISNIKLLKNDGSAVIVPRDSSYFLIKEENPSQTILLHNIPAGDYSGITFTIGVDSLKNTAPVEERTGCLDPATGGAGMYWSWNSGYIFLKMEGHSDTATSKDKKFRYHIGGFGGYSSPMFNNIKTVTLNTTGVEPAQVRGNKTKPPTIHILADAAKVLNGPMNISIAAKSTVMVSPYSVNLANNYVNMFSIDHIHND